MDKFRYEQKWTITISGRTKEAVKKAMDKVIAPTLGFGLLRMEDISSVATASTKIEDRKEGDKMDDEYEAETMYEASVSNSTIHFMFSYKDGVKRVRVKDAKRPTDWCSYHINTTTEVNYYVPNGTWILRIHVGCAPDWLFRDKVDGALSKAIIVKAWGIKPKYTDPETLKGRHYDAIIEDDMVDAFGYAVTANKDVEKEVKQVTEWYKKAKKEVKGKMYLQLIEVTIFNRKTKHIDFCENMIAENNDEAYLLAVQTFGKYDPKVHVKAANCILGFSEIGDKVED